MGTLAPRAVATELCLDCPRLSGQRLIRRLVVLVAFSRSRRFAAALAEEQRDVLRSLVRVMDEPIVLTTLFLVVGWLGRIVIRHRLSRRPSLVPRRRPRALAEPTFRNFVAVALLALLASRPHAHAHNEARPRDKG